MTAKERFEKLGYKPKYYISESKLLLIGYVYGDTEVNENLEGCDILFQVNGEYTTNIWVDNELHKAINKQIEELRCNNGRKI